MSDQKKTSNIIVGGYIRVSSAEQSREGLSLETQEATIKAYCATHGYTLRKIYCDAGITARKQIKKREAFMRMMGDVKAKKINRILVVRLDRFFRNVYDYHSMMNEYLIPSGCDWSAINEEYDTTTTNGRLMINLRLAIAEQECDQDSDRIKDVARKVISDKKAWGSGAPLGYKLQDKRVVIDEEKAELAKFMFAEYIRTGSYKATVKALWERGEMISMGSVRKAIGNERYIGRHRGIEDYCPALISKEDFALVQRIRAQHKRVHIKTGRVYLFSGLMRCPACGRMMSGLVSIKKGRESISYGCTNASRPKCPKRQTIGETLVERAVREQLQQHIKDLEVTIKEKKLGKTVDYDRKINEVDLKIDRLTDLYTSGLISKEEFSEKRKEYKATIQNLMDQKDASASAEEEAKRLEGVNIMMVDNVISSMSRKELSLLYQSIIDHIDFARDRTIKVHFV